MLQERAGYAAELEGLIEQMEGLVNGKAEAEAVRDQLSQQAADLAQQCQAAQVRGQECEGLLGRVVCQSPCSGACSRGIMCEVPSCLMTTTALVSRASSLSWRKLWQGMLLKQIP